MQFFTVKDYIKNGNIKEVVSTVRGSRKNQILDQLRDYYHGHQWNFNQGDFVGRTSFTRSGKEMWENKDKKRPYDMQFGRGELKTWNICDSTIDIYTTYCLGGANDPSRIIVENNEQLEGQLNDMFNVGDVVDRTVHKASIDSVAIWKMTPEGIEFIDAKEIFPIYYGQKRVGTIRSYEVLAGDPILEGFNAKDKKKYWFTEIWIPEDPEDESTMQLYKFVNEDGVNEPGQTIAPYPFDPYIVVVNKDAEFSEFDEDNIEISDVAKIIDIQDDLNAYITDISLINRKIAVPMYKIANIVYEMIADGKMNGDTVKEQLEQLNIHASRLLVAPIEKIETDGLPASSMQYLDQIFGQLYRTTGIPRSIYESQDLGNMATKTVERLMESLKRRIDEKRKNIDKGFKELVRKYNILTNENIPENDVFIEWSEMIAPTKEETAFMLLEGFKAGSLPKEYVIEKLLDTVGDGERLLEVLGMIQDNNLSEKIAFETVQINNQLRQESKEEMGRSQAELQKAREEAMQAQQEKSLLMKELQSI